MLFFFNFHVPKYSVVSFQQVRKRLDKSILESGRDEVVAVECCTGVFRYPLFYMSMANCVFLGNNPVQDPQ